MRARVVVVCTAGKRNDETEFKTARPDVQEVRLKVNEFTDFDNQ